MAFTTGYHTLTADWAKVSDNMGSGKLQAASNNFLAYVGTADPDVNSAGILPSLGELALTGLAGGEDIWVKARTPADVGNTIAILKG